MGVFSVSHCNCLVCVFLRKLARGLQLPRALHGARSWTMAITKKFNMTIVALSIASIASGCAMGGDPSAPGHASDEMAAALPAATVLGASNQQELEQIVSRGKGRLDNHHLFAAHRFFNGDAEFAV